MSYNTPEQQFIEIMKTDAELSKLYELVTRDETVINERLINELILRCKSHIAQIDDLEKNILTSN